MPNKSDFFSSVQVVAMKTAGEIIFQVKKELRDFVQPGVSFAEIDRLARQLIEKSGAQTNFDLEPGYKWATCINRNDGICHGIPYPDLYVDEGDVLKIDLGCSVDGWHVDTALSFIVGEDIRQARVLLERGQAALKKSIAAAKPGNSIYDLSRAMEKHLTKHGYQMVYQLTGHGIGRRMHESPYIPCIAQKADKKHLLRPGQGLAIEAMYAVGNARLIEARDGWTFATADGSLTGYFEETVIVTPDSLPLIVTNPELKLD